MDLSLLAGPQAWLAANGARLLGYLLVGVSLTSAGAVAGYRLAGVIKDADIAALKQQRAEERAATTSAALGQLQAAAGRVHDAAQAYGALQTTLGGEIARLREDLKNAQPLPPDCKPDAFRMLKLATAIDAARAAQQSAAGQ